MEAVDFSCSFLTFRIDTQAKTPRTVTHKPPLRVNNARIQLECCCSIRDKRSGATETFHLGASCKTERVGVERDIWTEPNADFAPIFSAAHYMNLKTYARVGIQVPLYYAGGDGGAAGVGSCGVERETAVPPGAEGTGPLQSDRQTGKVADTFDALRLDVAKRPGRLLTTAAEIVERVLANRPLVARTHLENDRYAATLEYPIKTINANEEQPLFQTDTGPVLLPDLEAPWDRLLPSFELAYAAFNAFDWLELLVRVPTPVDAPADSSTIQVYHYSRPVRYAARNEVIELL